MTREQREVLSQCICNFYCDAANKSVKTTINYIKKTKYSSKHCLLYIKKISTIWNDKGPFSKWSSSQIIHERLE